jgi:hypothetical protein
VLSPIKRGDIREQSFGFIIAENGDTWDNLDEKKKDKPVTRTITEVDELFDVSPVTFPAYPDTSVALRSMEKAKQLPFREATEADILNLKLLHYVNAKEPEESRVIAYDIIEILLPKLNDEQRTTLIPAPEVERNTPTDDEDILDEETDSEKTHQTDLRWQKLSKRINEQLNI